MVEVKRNGGAFQPFQREKSIGKTNGAVTKSPASAPATSSTADGVSGGNSKKEDKEGQRKQRRNWSPELHRRFLHALQQLGGSHSMFLKFLHVFEINLVGYIYTREIELNWMYILCMVV